MNYTNTIDCTKIMCQLTSQETCVDKQTTERNKIYTNNQKNENKR